jgi:hypothetical protein
MSNNNGVNYFNDLNNSDLLFINILNSMYNDNLRIVHHLIDQNTQIRNTLINIMNNRRSSNISNNNTNRNNNNNRNRANNENGTTNANQQRLYIIDNLPYYLDNSQMTALPSFNNNYEQVNTSRNYLNRTRNTNRVDITNHLSRILNSFLDPVNIIPTQIQIENATRNITYGDILDPINNSCPISLDQFTDSSNVTMIRHCRHIFNTNSLMSWFNSNCKCPVCRYDIRNYTSNNNRNNQQTSNNNNNNDIIDNVDNEYDNEYDNDNDNDNDNGNGNDNNNNNNNSQNATSETNENLRHINQNNRNDRNTRNNISRMNSIDTIFDILHDFSGNNILEYNIDDTSASTLFSLIYPQSRTRERRR